MGGVTLARSGSVIHRDGVPHIRVDGGCNGTAACPGCSAGRSLWLSDAGHGLAGGTRVHIEVPARGLTRVAAECFGLPLAALLAGAWFGARSAGWLELDGDTASALAGFTLLALAGVAVASRGAALTRRLELNIRPHGQDS